MLIPKVSDPIHPILDWQCPICDHQGCEKVIANIPVAVSGGGQYGAGLKKEQFCIGYKCSGCSITFHDPERFNKKKLNLH